MRVSAWVTDKYGFDGAFYALCFDKAVQQIGVWIENRANELTDKVRPKYKMEDILKPIKPQQARNPFASVMRVENLASYERVEKPREAAS